MPTDTIAWPVKTREFHNHHFDSSIWNDFAFRDDDIIISTYAKSGTTWVQQIVSQLNKLIDVVNVDDMTRGEHVERELVLVKLRIRADQKAAADGAVQRLGGRVLDSASDSYIAELTGSEAEVNGFVRELAGKGELMEVVRSGALGLARDARTLRVVQ